MRVRQGQKFHFVCMRFIQNKNWGVVEDRVYWKKMAWLDNERPRRGRYREGTVYISH